MIEVPETQHKEATEITRFVPSTHGSMIPNNVLKQWTRFFRQLLRFGLVGGLNTLVDLLVLNALLLLFPTKNTLTLLAYNSVAYALGAINSFLLNKYWTFEQRKSISRKEVLRFTVTTAFSILWSNGILWLIGTLLQPLHINALLWANVSKVFAIFGTVLISYLGMRLWVFVRKPQDE